MLDEERSSKKQQETAKKKEARETERQKNSECTPCLFRSFVRSFDYRVFAALLLVFCYFSVAVPVCMSKAYMA